MITTGISLAVLTCTGFWLIYTKLPDRLKSWMVKHALLTDVIACVFTYTLFGGTIIALFAAAFVGIIISILLALLNDEASAETLKVYADKISVIKGKLVDFVGKQVKATNA